MQNMEILELEKRYRNKVISIVVTYRAKPIKGRLIKATKDFMVLDRVSGDISTIRQSAVLGINEGRDVNEQVI